MKNNELHNSIDALNVELSAPRHQQKLKQALLGYDASKQPLGFRLRAAYKNIIGVSMSHKKTVFGAGTLSLAIVLALAVSTYNYQHSPRVQAEQLINQGIGFVRTVGSDQMSKIQTQLGGDPVDALTEAKAAKDLTVITKAEFDVEMSKHKGVAMSSLGKDGPQFGSVSVGNNGGLPPNPTAQGEAHFSTNGAAGGSVESGTMAVGEGVVVMSGSATATAVAGPSTTGPGAPEGADKVYTYRGESQDASISGQPANLATPPEFKPINPSKYLRYTNSTGNVVVLGLDEKGIPVVKTIFMNDSDLQNMQGPKLDVNQGN